MSDRELSNPIIYDISVDWDDAADGSDGGYDRKGNYVIPSAMREIICLRAERKGMRRAAIFWQDRSEELIEALENLERTAGLPSMLDDPVRVTARAAIAKAKGECNE